MPLQIQRSEGTGAIMTRLDRSERQRITIARAAEGLADPPLDRMIQRGHRVICIDNFFTGDVANVWPLMNHPAFSFIEHDVTRPIKIPGAIDRIYNLACRPRRGATSAIRSAP
ncbi:MAG TPA: hypothetical protein VFL51_05575 [Pseudolabrys sp.]|nr:hypothetical protein [Pseudolabrys sp.]